MTTSPNDIRLSQVKEDQVFYAHDMDLFKIIIPSLTMDQAARITSEYSLKQLSTAQGAKIKTDIGITTNAVRKIKAIFELSRRHESRTDETRKRIHGPEDVYKIIEPYTKGTDKERVTELILNTKNEIIKTVVISIGSLNTSIVHPREVFKPAIEQSACSIILCHNHPSGDPTPSKEDITVTKRIKETGDIIGIDLRDHVIIGDGRYISMRDEGYLK